MYDEIYTIGCFDFLHHGHIKLLESIKKMGKKIIAGIHDDESLEKLKKLKKTQHQNINIRMKNLKKYTDIVYLISDTDPTFYIKMIHNNNNKLKQCFIRANDNINFPGIEFVKNNMEIKYLPYTKEISSSLIRKNKSL
jgi:cytidyltransferase-like protein